MLRCDSFLGREKERKGEWDEGQREGGRRDGGKEREREEGTWGERGSDVGIKGERE